MKLRDLILPAYPGAHRANKKIEIKPWDSALGEWQNKIAGVPIAERDALFHRFAVAYSAALTRAGRFDGKASICLGAAALIVGALVVALGDANGIGEVLPLAIAGIFVISCLICAGSAVYPGQAPQLSASECLSTSGGAAEIATATDMFGPITLKVANLVTASLRDLARAAVLALIGLLLVLPLESTESDRPPESNPASTTSSSSQPRGLTTTAPTPGATSP